MWDILTRVFFTSCMHFLAFINKREKIYNVKLILFLFFVPKTLSFFKVNSMDSIVQVVLIAESRRLQASLNTYGIQTQTPEEIEPVQVSYFDFYQ